MSQKAKMKLSLQSLMGNTQGFNIGRMQAKQTNLLFLVYLSIQIAISHELWYVMCLVIMKPGESVSFPFILFMGKKNLEANVLPCYLWEIELRKELTIYSVRLYGIQILYMFMNCIQNW